MTMGQMDKSAVFLPHPLLAGGHRQTLAGSYLPSKHRVAGDRRHRVALADGDELVLHDDSPPDWRAGEPVAMLVHGLCGCHQSKYVVRLAGKLYERGVRAFRLDLRGCGAGEGLARTPTHCGRYTDLEAPIARIAEVAPDSPLTVIGFSLGAALTLGLAANHSTPPNWKNAVAICPPVDLFAVEQMLLRPIHCRYDFFFAQRLWKHVVHRARTVPGAPPVDRLTPPRRLREFDNRYTAPLAGYRDADEYYEQASVAPRLKDIQLPTLILAAANDPIVPLEPLKHATLGPRTGLLATDCGGHLGFVARRGVDPDRFWMDWRVLEWIEKQNPMAALATTDNQPHAVNPSPLAANP